MSDAWTGFAESSFAEITHPDIYVNDRATHSVSTDGILVRTHGKISSNMRYPPAPSNIGQRRRAQKPEGGHFHFGIVDELYIRQSGLPSKLIYLQKMKFDSDGRVELRLGYYIIGKRPAMRGRWVWGQFATMIPFEDFKRIVAKAKRKGWL